MIWFTWRQFRTQTWVTVGLLAVLGAFLVTTGLNIASSYAANVGTCHRDCQNAVANFLNQAMGGTNGIVFNLSLALLYVMPALIGMFWGAPLIARELEAGTHRLAWTQSVTRTRWLATKLGMVGGAAVATTGLLSWAVTAWAHHIDQVHGDRIRPLLYGARGIVPIGYALFAVVLGVTLGMLIRRLVPAMIATLGGYVAAVVSMPLWVRAHLAPVVGASYPLDISRPLAFMIGDDRMTVIAQEPSADAWVLSNQTVTPTGQAFTGPPDPLSCGPDQGPKACLDWVGTLGLRTDITFQPGSHFWQLQLAETGIFVAVAVLLAWFCFWWTRRRLS